jgi:hypothetical protein
MPVHLCLYHVKKAWVKNLILKAPGKTAGPHRKDMMAELNGVLHASSITAAKQALAAFYKKWSKVQEKFCDYFKSTWHLKLGERRARIKMFLQGAPVRCS